MAAGRGSRMKDFEGNKTLLPLSPGESPYRGNRPILLQILRSLPEGPKILVVKHRKEDIVSATRHMDLLFCDQPELNGTGGALLAARHILETQDYRHLIITMGDVPLVKPSTYLALVERLKDHALVVLGFKPRDKKRYGVLLTEGDRVRRIVEWKYWSRFPRGKQSALRICNSGIYAVRKTELLQYLPVLASKPHTVTKEIDGKPTQFNEYFITDLVEIMDGSGSPVGYGLAEDEDEVMGVDDLSALLKAQAAFAAQKKNNTP
jgi:bifunctional UDP-N-acetylglucosamine pyrophosphorylase/glucosamine-1-phosphate N-acetyltransferase